MSEDRISQLPDAILLQILSLIDTNEALQTTILSTRWRNLCFSISDLKFHLTRFAALRPSSADLSRRFSASVSHFLSHRDGTTSIRSFHISLDCNLAHADAAFVEKCVYCAVDHGVETLRVDAPSSRHTALRLPTFEALRELHLINQTIFITKRLSFPHLKTLHLESSSFIGDGSE